ncbi:hypothetical protein KCU77_g17641, partial [Aureobasidium melanogenum]
LHHDIASALGDQSNRKDWSFTEGDFNKLPCLRAFINESLRLRLNTPVIWRESTTPSILLHTAIPRGGTVITVSIWAKNRSVDEWGQDATDFDPDRWLDDGIGHARSAFSSMTLGQGPFKCIGELARTQMECVLAVLFVSLIFFSAQKPEVIDSSQRMITVKVWQGLRVFAQPVERAV